MFLSLRLFGPFSATRLPASAAVHLHEAVLQRLGFRVWGLGFSEKGLGS